MTNEFFCDLNVSNWIDITSIIVNGGLAFWIAKTLQNSMNNKRVLKDHFISEVKILKEEYFNLIDNISSNKCKPKELNSQFKTLNIKTNSLMLFLNKRYKIDTRFLTAYQIDLKKMVTEFDEYIYNFRENDDLILESDSLQKIIKFRQQNFGTFNSLIISINDK